MTFQLWPMFPVSASGPDWHREGAEGPDCHATSGEPGQREAERGNHPAAIERR